MDDQPIKNRRYGRLKICATLAGIVSLVGLACSTFAAETVSLETAPPVVVKSVPMAGAMDVDPNLTQIKVTFSKAMRDRSWSWCWWEKKEDYPETTGDPKYLKDSRTCVLPVKLRPNKFYAIWLNTEKFQNFRDASGQSAVPYLLTFFTGEQAEKRVAPASSFSDRLRVPASDKANRKFVRLVVGKGEMTFEGLPIIRDQLEARLSEIPDRAHTVFELAIVPELERVDELTANEFFEVEHLAAGWVKQLGFEYLSRVGYHPLGSKGGQRPQAANDSARHANDTFFNDDQRAVLEWTDRQFRSFFDRRSFAGWSADERATLETKLIDSLKGPRSTEYYQAINTLAALRSTKALPALREIAYDRREKDNRDRWMAVRAIGMIGDKSDIPELIPLVYHGNSNTRWWAQISLVRLTGQNFGKDWNAWGKWWNDDQNGQPKYDPEIIRWWKDQPAAEKLAEKLDESDASFIASLKPKVAASKNASGKSASSPEAKLKSLVEDFFHHNYRDITSRDTLEWGEPQTDDKGNSSIRYKYRAKIWDKNTITNNEVFTFDPRGKFVSVKQIYASPEERMTRLVEKFFGENYRDITSRDTLEWGEVVPANNGNASIRYKYRAKIWDKNTITNDQVFTFDSNDKFVSVEKNSAGAASVRSK